MVLIGNAIVSLDIFEQKFVCDLRHCKGMCCVDGVAGAPVEEEEKEIMNKIALMVKPYMRAAGWKEIEKQGAVIKDKAGDLETPLVYGEECAYAVFDVNGIAKCAIENAYFDGKVNFRKPISCHLYPIRIQKMDGLDALNYHEWEICRPAINNGKLEGIPVYKFTAEALIRKYGKEWYEELEATAKAYYEKQKTR
jgi:hypothetical protein